MSLSLAIKATRLLTAFSVSLWLGGGCLLGCGNVMGAEVSHSAHQSTAPKITGDSCHAAQSHCCGKAKSRQQTASRVNAPKGRTTQAPVSRAMQDCPLTMNATAVAAKHNGGNLPDAGRAPVAAQPRVESESKQTPIIIGSSYLPNRGPTHLRCCVFLI